MLLKCHSSAEGDEQPRALSGFGGGNEMRVPSPKISVVGIGDGDGVLRVVQAVRTSRTDGRRRWSGSAE